MKPAGSLCAIAPEDASASDLTDAIGELANVLGGNVKGLLPGPSLLSLPTVSAEEAPPRSVSSEAQELWFLCSGEPLVVLVLQHAAAA